VLATPALPAAPDARQLLSVDAVPGDRPGCVVVEVTGVVDSFTAPLLQLCLDSRTDRRNLRELVVDLEQVTFFGTAGAAALVRAHRRCRARGVRLFLRRGGRRRLLGPLQLAGLADLLSTDGVDDSRPQAAGSRTSSRFRPGPRRLSREREPHVDRPRRRRSAQPAFRRRSSGQ